jgi:succinate dehydrogenase/fumarate reductase flavoprotein subunit
MPAGLAGLTAAITAADNGALVTILEKEKSVGGNSAKATSGMNGCGTKAQDAAGVHDTESLFFADTISSGHGKSDPALVRTLAAQSKSAVEFICKHGVDLAAITLCGGHSVARTHHEAPRADGKPTPVGWDIIAALKKVVESRPSDFVLRTGARVLELLRSPSTGGPLGAAAVIGVKIQVSTANPAGGAATTVTEHEEELLSDAVILCTGGFGNDHTKDSLLAEFAPHLSCLPTTNGPFAQGEGVKIARSAGAYLRGMQEVQVHPTGFVDPADVMNRTKFLGRCRQYSATPKPPLTPCVQDLRLFEVWVVFCSTTMGSGS